MSLRRGSTIAAIAFTFRLLVPSADAQKIYWTDFVTDAIQRANLDGSDIEDIVPSVFAKPAGIALDPAAGKLYWTDDFTRKIQRANLDGSNVEDLSEGLAGRGIAVDPGAGKMYWAGSDAEVVYRANVDGSLVEQLVTTGPRTPLWIDLALAMGKTYWTARTFTDDAIQRGDLNGDGAETLFSISGATFQGLAVDEGLGKMYWTDWIPARIQRANLDGTNIEDILTSFDGLLQPQGIALDAPGGMMYFTRSHNTDQIQRAGLDGSNVEVVLGTGLSSPSALRLDLTAGKMYWTLPGTAKIERASLDGSNREVVVTNLLDQVEWIALDLPGGKVYWTDTGIGPLLSSVVGKVQRANLDGTNLEDLVIDQQLPRGIALDLNAGKMYWAGGRATYGSAKVQRANLDGTNVEELITTGLTFPVGIALDLDAGKMYITDAGYPETIRANLDGSGFESYLGIGGGGGIALDPSAGTMYWSNIFDRTIERANLDGTGVDVVVDLNGEKPGGIALDLENGKAYWTLLSGSPRIQRSNLDGSHVEDIHTNVPINASGIALDLTPPPPPIPAVSQWGMAVMGLLLVTAATIVFRSRRSTST